MLGSSFEMVECRRGDLRFPLPARFVKRLTGARVETLVRRGKYIVGDLSTGESLIMHLGMSGRFTLEGMTGPTLANAAGPTDPRHDHVLFVMRRGKKAARILFNDPRRFGLMDLVATADVTTSRHFTAMGPEPLSVEFSEVAFIAALEARSAPIKSALLDQRLVAGIGNIYACEALHRAGVSPRRKALNVGAARAARLHRSIKDVLVEAIEAGGSSLKDFAGSDGALGYFQHRFRVYDREGEACRACAAPVRRIVQSGRSTFFCAACQR